MGMGMGMYVRGGRRKGRKEEREEGKERKEGRKGGAPTLHTGVGSRLLA